MSKKRLSFLVALLSSVLLFGCTSGEAPTSESGGKGAANGAGSANKCKKKLSDVKTKDGEIKFSAGPGKWDAYNSVLSSTYSTYNSAISRMLSSSFVYYGTDGSLCEDKDFGTIKVLSEKPLKVEYTISDKAVWSDGTPVTFNDFLLDYVAQNPEWLSPKKPDGTQTPVFNHVSVDFAKYTKDIPKGEVNGKKFTVDWKDFPDWKLVVGSTLMPAHVVARHAGLKPEELAKAILDKNVNVVKKTANFWNDGWVFKEDGKLPDLADIPSYGPYKVKKDGWIAGTSLTLEANDKYGGVPPTTKNFIFRFIADSEQAAALKNSELSVISPQADTDLIGQLKDMGSAVKMESYSNMSWEHLDFNFGNKSVFADSKGGLKLRQAFAYCVPRQDIIDKLIKPINEKAVILNAREAFPFQTKKYSEITKASYNGQYDKVNLEKAKQLIKESGIAGPIKIRFGFKQGQKRREDTFRIIKSSCDQVGFDVQSIASPSFFQKDLTNGDYEVALYAWAGSGQVVSGQNIYSTGRPQNYNKYSNKKVDEAWAKIASSLDKKVHLEQTKIIEKTLWDTLHGIPLYAHPAVAAWQQNIENVIPTAVQDGISWNGEQWLIK